jgi:hypothetical protein
MLVRVKVALKLWLIILKSRVKLEKRTFYKNCSNESNLNYLFHNLSSQMKGWKDNKAVWFEFEFTSYATGYELRPTAMSMSRGLRDSYPINMFQGRK